MSAVAFVFTRVVRWFPVAKIRVLFYFLFFYFEYANEENERKKGRGQIRGIERMVGRAKE